MPIDNVNNPPHYTYSSIECIEAIEAALGKDGFIAFLKGQVIKYAWRLEHKGEPLENAQKLQWYANKLESRL